jgi:hypothetical protein
MLNMTKTMGSAEVVVATAAAKCQQMAELLHAVLAVADICGTAWVDATIPRRDNA